MTARLVSKSLLKEGVTGDNGWHMITFIVEKQHRKKKKKFVFVAFNKVAKQILYTPNKERITIKFEINCKEHGGKWFTNLKVTEVSKYVSKKKIKSTMRVGEKPLEVLDYTVHDDRPLFNDLEGNNG